MPRVTVVMPVHAQAAWVPRAVGSLLAQDEADWELVVVDDASPDDVAGALPADPRIRRIGFDHNRGLGAALNAGLEAAAAAAIAYLPADDVWHRKHLSALLPLLEDAEAARSGEALAHLVHRATTARWLTRETLETDRLDLLDHLTPVATPARPTATPHPAPRSAARGAVGDARRRRERLPAPLPRHDAAAHRGPRRHAGRRGRLLRALPRPAATRADRRRPADPAGRRVRLQPRAGARPPGTGPRAARPLGSTTPSAS